MEIEYQVITLVNKKPVQSWKSYLLYHLISFTISMK